MRKTSIVLAVAGCSLSVAALAEVRQENPPASPAPVIAKMFPSPADTEARRCFPARYLELWRDDIPPPLGASCGPGTEDLAALRRYFRDGQRGETGTPPRLGISLEGGGSKTAPFALGVLAGLQEAGLLQDAEAIASVSGGSYAAYFYFSRLFDQAGAPAGPGPDKWFDDCVPSAYLAHFGYAGRDPRSALGGLHFCGEPGRPKPSLGLEDPGVGHFRKHYPDQFQVRFYQDLFSPDGDLRSATARGEHLDVAGSLGAMTIAHGATFYPLDLGGPLGILSGAHNIAHTLFDWPMNFSPSREVYRQGIETAYGYSPQDWNTWLAQKAAGQAGPCVEPTDGAQTQSLACRRLNRRLADLGRRHCPAAADGTHRCDIPLWVINTTASGGRDPLAWIRPPEKDTLRRQLELTPLGHGAGLFGFIDRPADLSLNEAVGASAAFLDEEERIFADAPVRLPVSALLHFFNADWGTNLPNFNASDPKRLLHNLSPWPLYTLPYFRGADAPYIHLTDGGNTDNLGLYSLLRRGVRNIVVSASTDDRAGQFPSLCNAKNQLELDGTYRLLMPELEDFPGVCNQALGAPEEAVWVGGDSLQRRTPAENPVLNLFCRRQFGQHFSDEACRAAYDGRRKPKLGYDLFAWQAPVLEGCVVYDPHGTLAEPPLGDRADTPAPKAVAARSGPRIGSPGACAGLDFLPPGTAPGDAHPHLVARLFVIKPAVHLDRYDQQVTLPAGEKAPPPRCGAHVLSAPSITHCPEKAGQRFVNPNGSTAPAATPLDIPCQSLALMLDEACHPDGKPKFPQHDFVWMTLNSSYQLFGAYYDLGRHYARQLAWRAGDRERLERNFPAPPPCHNAATCPQPISRKTP